jgi:hypothetical protein
MPRDWRDAIGAQGMTPIDYLIQAYNLKRGVRLRRDDGVEGVVTMTTAAGVMIEWEDGGPTPKKYRPKGLSIIKPQPKEET